MKTNFRPDDNFTKDTGLVVVLMLMIIAYWAKKPFYILPAIAVLVVVMVVPFVLKPLAAVWFHVSTFFGGFMNRFILAIVFWGVLMPVSLIRRALGYDPMKQKEWKKGRQSVFKVRSHTFTSDDMIMPY
jgi:hypothetical protein